MEERQVVKTGRLDKWLMKEFPALSLAEVYQWLRKGRVKVNRKKCRHDTRVQKDDTVQLFVPSKNLKNYEKKGRTNKMSFTVLFEDDSLLIVNKPQLLATQGGLGVEENNLINQVRYYLHNSRATIALANRLDKGTSGIVMMGKTPVMNAALYEAMKKQQITKKYSVLVHGNVTKKKGSWHHYLRRRIRGFRPVMELATKDEPLAKEAKATYVVKKQFKQYALLEVTLITGRMHQIRVQSEAMGHPVVGDVLYGIKDDKKIIRRPFLHAQKVFFTHPLTEKNLAIEAPLPDDLVKFLKNI